MRVSLTDSHPLPHASVAAEAGFSSLRSPGTPPAPRPTDVSRESLGWRFGFERDGLREPEEVAGVIVGPDPL